MYIELHYSTLALIVIVTFFASGLCMAGAQTGNEDPF